MTNENTISLGNISLGIAIGMAINDRLMVSIVFVVISIFLFIALLFSKEEETK